MDKPAPTDNATDALANLRVIGLSLEIPAAKARAIWAELQIIDGRYRRGGYRDKIRGHLLAAYDAIATHVVSADTPDDVLESLIPNMVEGFWRKRKWLPATPSETLKILLEGAVITWKGERLKAPPDDVTERKPPALEPIGEAIPAAISTTNDRRQLIALFKRKAKERGIKATDQMIAKAASATWNDRTMVTWWKRNDSRCKLAHDKRIRAVLAKDPTFFWPPHIKPKRPV